MMAGDLAQQIEQQQIQLIRAIYVGPEGITRGKAFRPGYLAAVLEGGIGLTQAQTSVTVFDQLPRESRYQPVGEIRIRPDVATFRVLPYLPGHARMLADLVTLDGQPWELCSRDLLKQALQLLRERGMVMQAAFENEFTLYAEHEGQWLPIHDLNCFSSAAMDIASAFILPVIAALESQGVKVEKYFPEAGPGQQELPVAHAEGILAADQQVVFRETVRGVATATGYRVSFMPKADANAAGNGCHIHFSLWDAVRTSNLFYDPAGQFQLSKLGRHFVAGVLTHLPALLALTAPTTNSYRRFVERCWSSCYVCWGPDNREASVRVASSFHGQEAATLNLEYKPCDPTCNPYLALAGLIFAGLDGVDRQLLPPEPLLTDPALLSADDRHARKLERYPTHLKAALDALVGDKVLYTRLGHNRVDDYVILKRAEIAAIEARGEGAEAQAYLFRF